MTGKQKAATVGVSIAVLALILLIGTSTSAADAQPAVPSPLVVPMKTQFSISMSLDQKRGP